MKLKWYHYLISFAIIVASVFCCIELGDMFMRSSGTYGSPITIEETMDLSTVQRYDLGTVLLEKENSGNIYCLTETYSPIDFDGTKNNYYIMFNQELLHSIDLHAGYISGIYTKSFYDTDNTLICIIDLLIEIEYTEKATTMQLSATNTNDCVSYFYTHTLLNGAVVQLVMEA